MSAPRGGSSSQVGGRLVVVSVDEEIYRGRTSRRDRLLAARPIDPTEAAVVGQSVASRTTGAYWEYQLADDSPLMLRARDLADDEEARWDATRVFESSAALRVLYVRDSESAQLAWWIVREREVILVAPRVWLPSHRTSVVRHAARAVAALRQMPDWKRYDLRG